MSANAQCMHTYGVDTTLFAYVMLLRFVAYPDVVCGARLKVSVFRFQGHMCLKIHSFQYEDMGTGTMA